MRCNCCDKQLNEKEIQWNPEIDAWEMCSTCLDVAYDAAYSNGFQHDDNERGIIFVGEESFDESVANDYTLQMTTNTNWYLEEEEWDIE